MSKIDNLSSTDVIKVLLKIGYNIIRQKGSHILLKNKNNKLIVVPNHKNLKIGTIFQIIKSTGLDKKEFEKLI